MPQSPIVTLVNSPPPIQSPHSQDSPEEEAELDETGTADVFARYHGESSEVVFTLAASELKPSADARQRMFKISEAGVTSPDLFPRRRAQFWMCSKVRRTRYLSWMFYLDEM